MSQGARNRPISTFVATFAALSLVASVAPLLVRGAADQSLVPRLDRQTSFAVYSVFLLLFAFFFLPGTFRREVGRSLGPWWALGGFALLFASIPAIVAAYISGVALPQAAFVGGVIACACAVVILLRAALGPAAAPVCFAIGGLTLFAVPAIEFLCWTTGAPAAVSLAPFSIVGWLRRLAFLREPVDPRGVALAAVVLWASVVGVAVRGGKRLAAIAPAALVLPFVIPIAVTFPPPPGEVVIKPLLGPVARPGARLPVTVAVKGAAGTADLAFRTETLRIPADGQPHLALIALAPGESDAELISGSERVRTPLPFRWLDPGRAAVGVIDGEPLASELAAALPGADIVPVDLAALPPIAGALETFDAIATSGARWAALDGPRREMLLGFAALSGSLVVIGPPAAADTRPSASGMRVVASAADLAAFDLRRTIGPDPFDPTLKSLFARPDWQALDLTGLFLFLILYHVGFLLAFLLPLLLDSHKSTKVYLVSVGGVMAVVVAVGWWSVRQVFLRDNQVYTQALTYVAVPAGDAIAAARQFRCYASMSGERRGMPWSAERDLVDYRDRGRSQRVLDLGARRLQDVWLDRFHAKLLVREDLAMRAPFSIEAEDGGFRLRPNAGAPDPLGLMGARITRAAVLEPDGSMRAANVVGHRISLGGPVDPAAASAMDPMARALIGRFRRGPGGRLLVLRVAGAKRLDDTSGFFKTEDLEAVLTFDV